MIEGTRAQVTTVARVEHFRTFAQLLPNHNWTATLDGQLDWFNDQSLAYSGAQQADLRGDGWATLVHPDDAKLAAGQWAAALASGDGYETEFRIRREDGVYRWHLVRALPIRDDDGNILRWH